MYKLYIQLIYQYFSCKKQRVQRQQLGKQTVTDALSMGRYSVWPVVGTLILTYLAVAALLFDFIRRDYIGLSPFLIIISVLIAFALFACICTDPGILPQTMNLYQTEQQLFRIPSANNYEGSQKYLFPNQNMLVWQKFCGQCKIFRPVRAIHCHTCNHCVQRYDHHCPWLSMCIGKFNYKYFLAYIILMGIFDLYGFICCCIIIFANLSGSPGQVFLNNIIEVILGIAALGFGFAIFQLIFYHLKLILMKLTTNQQVKQIYRIVNQNVPFQRCYQQRPRNSFRVDHYLYKPRRTFHNLNGQRYYKEQAQDKLDLSDFHTDGTQVKSKARVNLIQNQQL